ncbi:MULTISPECIES: S-methyl-5-thioribose-1-phosphate isomerase [unclassified Leucobacter]|uniref:S-methyl-5-thioribose-1-phosphate isomerase n=1 Tax=unclassified Leucobacter TaxID=2621730 RepID=UPI00165D85EC|nr:MULTISPECIES: S-methyl-5-thioribose-1-phosphate isomerase [unclassified Leucobacter]MBC9926435.1 S-methyl-5-thioribose-1-phosphate isomerase [Leucobacter sp. cx-169]MBC9937005.1 S-methyl-5-thioribose-1-phosphate isomerase [Leucobacter sp. cx-87]
MVRAIEWVNAGTESHIRLLDQTLLPSEETYLEVDSSDVLIDAINRLAVRGAPALGAAGGYGVALALLEGSRKGWSAAETTAAIDAIALARPTAVNLAWGARRVESVAGGDFDRALAEAHAIAVEDEAANRKLSSLGADWLLARVGDRPLRAVTHCNTGALATTAWGTAYGILHELHNRGKLELVYVDETRPLLQGTRLTSWELKNDGINHVVEVDGAAASTILRGLVDFAVIGADRITANGDTANKVGSVALALACARAGIPFVVAAPYSTVDESTLTGDAIEIEERSDDEVLSFAGVRAAAEGVRAFNPAFDVTPHDLISAIVTEHGVVEADRAPQPLYPATSNG